ncbi:MAG: formate dehydrogenase accessory protein FdhE [Ardenticatenaceae bacterium]
MNEVDAQVLEALEAARASVGDEDQLFAFYRRLLQAIAGKKKHIELLPELLLRSEETILLVRAGKPYLSFATLQLDSTDFHAWLMEIARLFESNDPGVMAEIEEITPAQSMVLAREWFVEGGTGRGSTVDTILANALAPYLEAAAETLLPLLPLHNWHRHYCPVCGGLPDFGLWSEEQMTTLLCERCRATWQAPVVGCLFCGETDPGRRGIYASEDNVYVVEVCDTCGNYVKGMNREALEPGTHPLLPAERLLTPGLDLTAIQEGYRRPAAVR